MGAITTQPRIHTCEPQTSCVHTSKMNNATYFVCLWDHYQILLQKKCILTVSRDYLGIPFFMIINLYKQNEHVVLFKIHDYYSVSSQSYNYKISFNDISLMDIYNCKVQFHINILKIWSGHWFQSFNRFWFYSSGLNIVIGQWPKIFWKWPTIYKICRSNWPRGFLQKTINFILIIVRTVV